jgi:late competence protein required for DNA uptake (superfamily II DNA/RNA helicase)
MSYGRSESKYEAALGKGAFKISSQLEVYLHTLVQSLSFKRSILERKDFKQFISNTLKDDQTKLSKEQIRAITSRARETMIIAGAGSGKTTVLIERAKHLVISGRFKADEILMLAYNKDAARESAQRLEAVGLSIEAQTFHGFGNSVIRKPGVRTGVAFGGEGKVSKFLEYQIKKGLSEESAGILLSI